MLSRSVLNSVDLYLTEVRKAGIDVQSAIVFGSQAKGTADQWSDIDLLVISPAFDRADSQSLVRILWRLRAFTDSRIEPIPCGSLEWAQPLSVRPIVEIARKEGVEVAA